MNYSENAEWRKRNSGPWLALLWAAALMVAFLVMLVVHYRDSTLLRSSNSDHGDTLDEVITRLADEDHEVIALFDMSGKKLFEWTSGETDHIETPKEVFDLANDYSIGGVIALHNHPQDAPFSDGDLLMASQARCKQQIVISPHAIYTLEAPNSWPSPRDAQAFLRETIYDNFLAAKALGYISVISDDKFYTTSQYIEYYAEEFGLNFTVQALNR